MINRDEILRIRLEVLKDIIAILKRNNVPILYAYEVVRKCAVTYGLKG